MNNSSTWHLLFVLLSFIHCILLPLTSAWKIAPSEIPADSILSNGETNVESEGTPGWIDDVIGSSNKVPHSAQTWYSLNSQPYTKRKDSRLNRDRRFFCNPMGCI
ncbi:unnamed protein product [Trichobilharzia szidati]|nr:unnamed protein product [Trichobilharzia szidati]